MTQLDNIRTKAICHVNKEDKKDDELAESLSSDEVFLLTFCLHVILFSLINLDQEKGPFTIVSQYLPLQTRDLTFLPPLPSTQL